MTWTMYKEHAQGPAGYQVSVTGSQYEMFWVFVDTLRGLQLNVHVRALKFRREGCHGTIHRLMDAVLATARNLCYPIRGDSRRGRRYR
jgi:hypothetical protein